MAEKTEFLQAIDDAILDADSLEQFINGSEDETVLTRLSAEYPTLQKALKELFENGGIAGRFKTLTALQASSLTDGDYALVTDDIDSKNGIYIKESNAWVKSKYDQFALMKNYIANNSLARIIQPYPFNINYLTATRELVFSANCYIFSSTTRYKLSSEKRVSIQTDGVYRLEYVVSTGELQAKIYSYNIEDGALSLGNFTVDKSGIYTKDFTFTVDSAISEGAKKADLHGFDDSVSIDTAKKEIRLKNARLVSDDSFSEQVTSQTISFADIPANDVNSTQYLLYNTTDKLFFYKNSISQLQTQRNVRLVASFIPSTGSIRGLGIPYVRDGQLVGGYPTTNIGIALSTDSSLNFNFSFNKIEISGVVQVLHNGDRIQLQPQEIDISSFASGLWFSLGVNASTATIAVLPTNTAYDKNLVIIGAFRKDIKAVAHIDNYSVDGVSNKAAATAGSSAKKLPSLGWDLQGVYSAPVLQGHRHTRDPIPAVDITSDMIHDWFDGLVQRSPDYITKTHLGNEYTGLAINEYRFKPNMGGSTKPIKILIHGGTHGEPMSYLLPYYTMKLIADNWQDDPLLEALRFGVEFSVIPAVNAWGITNGNNRYNSRDVNLNRNYPVDWITTEDHPGTEPLSELEAQYAYANMVSFKPHVALDVHSFGTTETGEFLWMTVESSPEALSVGSSMINRMRQKWVKETPDMVLASVLDRNGDAISRGSTVRAMKELGAISLTFEVGTKIIGEQPLAEPYSELSVRYGVEALINYLIIMLRRNA